MGCLLLRLSYLSYLSFVSKDNKESCEKGKCFLCVANLSSSGLLLLQVLDMDGVLALVRLKLKKYLAGKQKWMLEAKDEFTTCSSWANVSMRFCCLSYARARSLN